MTGRRAVLVLALLMAVVTPVRGQTIAVNGVAAPTAVSISAGTAIAAAIDGGPGGATDWIALYPAGAADGAYLDWRYLNGTTTPPASGVTTATIAFVAPLTPGSYELRLFANNGYARLATSGVVSVTASSAQLAVNGVAAPAPTTATAGGTITVAVSGGPGNPTDWVGFYLVGGADGAHLDWRYLNGATVAPATGLAVATLSFLAPVTPGDYEFRLLLNNGYGRVATSGAVTVVPSPAALTINGTAPPTAVTVGAGSTVAVGVTDGPANPGDWVGLYTANTPDSAYVTWRYLNGITTVPAAGTAAASLNIGVPTSAGSFEFRFFAANGYTRLATSTTMVVSSSTARLDVNGVSAPGSVTAVAGSTGVVSVSGGPANPTDWVALYPVGAADGAYLDWRYLNDTAVAPATGQSAAALHFQIPTTSGTYELRFFADNGYGLLATSASVVVPPSQAQIVVEGLLPPNSVATQPGAAVGVQVGNGPGNPTDWIALAEASAPDALYETWQYLNGSTTPPAQGVATATLSFTMPSSPGAYELRLFANNGFSRLATSAALVSSADPPAVSVTLTRPFPGTTFVTPSSVTLEADAVVSNGTITRMEFFSGPILVGTSTLSPYQTVWNAPTVGAHVLTAVATDSAGFATSSDPVSIMISATGGGFGTLGTPIVDPPSGVYRPNQPVVLTAASGATIRYTTNGTGPTETSPTYTAPVLLTESTELRARAYQSGWTPSDVVVATYQIDGVLPTITTRTTPAPNAAGWNNAAVTVTFECSDAFGMASCPPPIVVDTDGAGQIVNGTAFDLAGNQATATATVSIDKGPGAIAITQPVDQAVTLDASIQVQATASDQLSGLASATCNGVPASITSIGEIACTVPLSPGANSIVVQVTDVARNSASQGLRVVRSEPTTALVIAPSSRTLLVGDTAVVKVVDQIGTPVSGVTWTSSDPTVAAVAADGSSILTAMGSGEAVVTAAAGDLSAELRVTVLGGDTMPVGTSVWKLSTPSSLLGWSMPAQMLQPGGPEQFTLSYDAVAGAFLHAVTADGELAWTEPIGGYPAFADAFGGVVVSGYGAAGHVSLTRIGGATGGAPWEYQAAGWPALGLAQGPDGTIYHLEYNEPPGWAPPGFLPLEAYRTISLVTLDGRTGLVKGRTMLPSYRQCGQPPLNSLGGSSLPTVFVGGDGAAYVGVTTREEDCAPAGGPYISRVRTYLLRADDTGGSALITVRSSDESIICDPLCAGSVAHPQLRELKPDGQGGMLLRGTDFVYEIATAESEARPWALQYRNETVFDMESADFGEISLVAHDDTIYSTDNDGETRNLRARSSAGAVKWSASLVEGELPLEALPNSGALLYNAATGALTRIDETGARVQSDVLPRLLGPLRTAVDQLSGPLVQGPPDAPTFAGEIVKISTSGHDRNAAFPNPQGRNATVQQPETGIFAKGHDVFFGYSHVSVRIVPKNQSFWRQQLPRLFVNPLGGLWFATLGAGPSIPNSCDGFLASTPNRGADVKNPHTHLRRLGVAAEEEDAKIGLLFDRDENFDDTDLLYACFPDVPLPDNRYNSNGFARGLLGASGIPEPAFPVDASDDATYPGWVKPVPLDKFN
jgi:hypothetical protein